MSSWWPLGQLQQRSYRVARFTEALRVDRLPLPSNKVFRWSEISLPGGRFLLSTLLLETYINKYRRNLVYFCNSVRQKVYLRNGVFVVVGKIFAIQRILGIIVSQKYLTN